MNFSFFHQTFPVSVKGVSYEPIKRRFPEKNLMESVGFKEKFNYVTDVTGPCNKRNIGDDHDKSL